MKSQKLIDGSMRLVTLYTWCGDGVRRWVGWRLWRAYRGGGGRAMLDLRLRWWLS